MRGELTDLELLFEQLRAYGQGGYYPYHMPGHKRNALGGLPGEIAQIDITEIEGFDNLHQPEGILRKLQEEAAALYHAEQSFYLVNGSTAGVLGAISAAVPEGGHILMARNSHKSAYHGAYLRKLRISYLYPRLMAEYDICDAITPGQVREALRKEPGIQAVFVTSPTYEGRIADIASIADEAHCAGIPLIVDEAHGAHLGLAEGFAANSCQAGADIVIHSVHKTLTGLTQTALLHVNGKLVSREALRKYLQIYQTSSPSYLLMASIDNALRIVREQGGMLFAQFQARYAAMLEELSACRYLRFLPEVGGLGASGLDLAAVMSGSGSTEDAPASERPLFAENAAADESGAWVNGRQDIGKLVISVRNTGISGQELYRILLEKYHLQLEMASASHCLAMFTIGDGREAYDRMAAALLDIENDLASGHLRGQKASKGKGGGEPETSVAAFLQDWNAHPALPLADAWDAEKEWVPLEQAAGRLAGEFVSLYPPGIPLLVPGEAVSARHCQTLAECLRQGLRVQGVQQKQGQYCVNGMK